MQRWLERFDRLWQPDNTNQAALWLDRVIFTFLVLMAVAAPFSIAATQTAWLIGMFLWVIRFFVRPRPRMKFGFIDGALWAFFIWSVISAVFSYEPLTSLDRVRLVALFLIFYFVYYNIRNLRSAYFFALVLIFAGSVAAAYVPIQKMIGRGVEIRGLSGGSVLANAGIEDGFTLLRADGKKINSPDELATHIAARAVTRLEYYKPDFEFETFVRSADLPAGGTATERLGIQRWTRGTVPRSTGFFGHWTTLSEVMQLIASLALGLFAAGFLKRAHESRPRTLVSIVLVVGLVLMCAAMLLSITRASQMGFMIAAFIILLLTGSRKLILAAVLLTIPIAVGALLFLQETRQIGVADARDPSTQYRATLWRDGYRLWTDNPRHFVFGIGMDSVKTRWREWGMFDGGRLPVGHFHSTPVQIAVERGLPGLLLWLAVLGIYWRTLWQAIRGQADIKRTGILLGCFAGSIGFFVSGFVHYNLGDSEVAMVFFMLMGLGMRVASNPNPRERFAPKKESPLSSSLDRSHRRTHF